MQGITQSSLHMHAGNNCPAGQKTPALFGSSRHITQYRVELERQKVQQKEYLTGMLLPMPKVVFQMVPAVFQYVIMLVLYLPPRSCA